MDILLYQWKKFLCRPIWNKFQKTPSTSTAVTVKDPPFRYHPASMILAFWDDRLVDLNLQPRTTNFVGVIKQPLGTHISQVLALLDCYFLTHSSHNNNIFDRGRQTPKIYNVYNFYKGKLWLAKEGWCFPYVCCTAILCQVFRCTEMIGVSRKPCSEVGCWRDIFSSVKILQ